MAASTTPLAGMDAATAPPVMLTSEQWTELMNMMRMTPAVTVSHNYSNFAECPTRFDGSKKSDVMAFISAIEGYMECVSMDPNIALKGLPMLLTGIAATWWLGVKHSVNEWKEAVQLLQQTFSRRLPPHRIYRELFSQEQGNETTDVFVYKARALIAQLPPGSLEEEVQLDTIYGAQGRIAVNTGAEMSIASDGTDEDNEATDEDNEATLMSLVDNKEDEILSECSPENINIFRPRGGATTFTVHSIAEDAAPVTVPPYRVTPSQNVIIKKEILEDEKIEEAESAWLPPMVVVPENETQFCVNYHAVEHRRPALVSPTTCDVIDDSDALRGKHRASDLAHYSEQANEIFHQRKRRRLHHKRKRGRPTVKMKHEEPSRTRVVRVTWKGRM